MSTRPQHLSVTALLFLSLLAGCKTHTSTTKNPAQPVADNSQNALDWPGIYQGTTPCADCEGIQTILTLNSDLTYVLKRRYVGREGGFRETKGSFTWTTEGRQILLPEAEPIQFLVGENRLVQLDRAGQRITGDRARQYELGKTPDGLTETYWKLIELMGNKIGPTPQDRREPHLMLKTENNRVAGYANCNNLMGSYQLFSNSRITFSQMASTQMACPDMATEQQFVKALTTADSYVLKGDTLILNRARMASLARFVAVRR